MNTNCKKTSGENLVIESVKSTREINKDLVGVKSLVKGCIYVNDNVRESGLCAKIKHFGMDT